MPTIEGYDSPIASREDDILHRWPFVREIALLACTAPKGWPVRIGVYGTWGTGKSSVLYLASSLIEEQGDIATFFNPWGYDDAKAMLGALAEVALDAAKSARVDVAGRIGRRARKLTGQASRLFMAGESLAGDADKIVPGARIAAKLASATRPLLDRLLDDRAKTFARISEALEDRRLVILIDDVDRADPAVLPSLLFAVHQMMAAANLSYIVALDPEIVSVALKEHHPGFGSGTAFLEKIVQFPRWLPEPTSEDLLQLSLRDAAEHAPFLPQDVLRREATLLPRNPRALRTAIRNLWTLQEEAGRHLEDEIDWSLALVLHMLRVDYPELFRTTILHNETLEALFRSGLRGAGVRNAPVEVDISDLVERTVAAPDLRPRAVQLLQRLFGRSNFWLPDRIIYHALLADRPHAVTWKEFGEFRAAFAQNPSSETISEWAAKHAAARHDRPERVFEELFTTTLTAHDRALASAADSRSDEQASGYTEAASSALDILRALVFGLRPQFEITASRFKQVLEGLRRWAHFDNTQRYRDLRGKERTFLLEIVARSSIPIDVLEILAPWDPSAATDRQKVVLTNELAEAASRLTADRLAEVFLRPSAVEGIVNGNASAGRYVLFSRERYWTRDRVEDLARRIEADHPAVPENCTAFLEALGDDQFQGKWGAGRDAINDLRGDRDLVLTLWRGSTAVAPNIRFFSSYDRLRSRLFEKTQIDLPLPSWWQRIQDELVRSEAERRARDDEATDDG